MKTILTLLVATALVSSSLSASLGPAPPKPLQILNAKPSTPLPVPQLKQTDVFEDRLVMKWEPVEVDEENPILGFKVKMWEEETKQVFFFEEINGVKQLISKLEPVETDMETIPASDPIVVVVGPQETEATIKDVKKHVRYQIRLQTFNEDGEGPYSPPTGIKIGNDISKEL